MCYLIPKHFEGCGHDEKVWKYCENVRSPRVKVDPENGNAPNCDHFWEGVPESVKNCCSFECCVNDVENQQYSVRKYEVLVRCMPGARYGVDYLQSAIPGVQLSDMENSHLAQSYSLQSAGRHVERCCSAIQPGSKESGGYLTDAQLELQSISIDDYMSLETQLARIWREFAQEIAVGILRAVHAHKEGQQYVVSRLQQILAELLDLRNQGPPFQFRERTLLRLIYLGLPDSRTVAVEQQVQSPPPVPDFEGDDYDKKNKRLRLLENLVGMAEPQWEWQKVLRSNPVQQFRNLFLGRTVTTTELGLLLE